MAASEPEMSLEQLYAPHVGKVSDKWSIYVFEYGRLFQEFRASPVRLLEIGIQNGGSLDIWARFFPDAERIVGCDIDPACAGLEYDDSKIQVVVGDVNTDGTQARIFKHSSVFDVIIDDGSHHTSDIVKSFARYFPCLADGGLFVVEDLHCSYWKEFEGGLFHPYSSMAFFKRLADVANHEHWGVDKSPAQVLGGFFRRYGLSIDDSTLLQVHSIEFINSMCVVRKRRAELNCLGARVIAGTVESVAQGHLHRHRAMAQPNSQLHNEWSVRELPPEEELPLRCADLVERDMLIGELRTAAAVKDDDTARWRALAEDRHQNLVDYEHRVSVLQNAVSNRDGQVAAFGSLLGEKEHILQRLHLTLEERAAREAKLQQALGDSHERVGQLVGAVAERDGQVAHLTLALADKDRRIAQFEGARSMQDEAVERLIQSITERDGQIGHMHVTVAQRDADIGDLTRRLGAQDVQFGETSLKLTERDAELEGSRRTLANQERHIDGLHRNIAQRDGELDRLQRAIGERDGAIASLHRTIEHRDLQLQSSHRSLESANSQVFSCNDRMVASERNVEQMMLASSAQARQLEELRSTLAAREEQISQAHLALANIEAGKWANRVRGYFARLGNR